MSAPEERPCADCGALTTNVDPPTCGRCRQAASAAAAALSGARS